MVNVLCKTKARIRAKKKLAAYEREARVKQQTPAHANPEAMKKIVKDVGLLSKSTGTPYELDHVIPLKGEKVSGLNVQGNMMAVPRHINRAKGNKFTPGDDPMTFNDQALKNIKEQNEKGLLGGAAGTAGLAGLLAAGQSEDSEASVDDLLDSLFAEAMKAKK